MPKINPEILRWARERAGLNAEDAAKAIGLTGAQAVDRLEEMERGEREPTRRQLGEIAKKYRRPLLTFYLAAPPAPGKRTHDFRTLPERQAGGDAVLDALLRDIKARQALVLGAIEETDGADTLPLVGSMTMAQGADAVASEMARVLEFGRAEYRGARNVEDAFKLLRDACERAGVYVILMGNLGSFHSALGPEVFRGFAMADPTAPFIVINENDTRSAWAFTLLHELAHILLGESGISGYGSDEAIERLCDTAAARFLLAPAELNELRPFAGSVDRLFAAIGTFATPRKVSRTMVAYNLWRAGVISAPMYRQVADRFTAERVERAQRQARGPGGLLRRQAPSYRAGAHPSGESNGRGGFPLIYRGRQGPWRETYRGRAHDGAGGLAHALSTGCRYDDPRRSDFYPLRRFPVFWRWLKHQGEQGVIKMPLEQLEEVTVGQGALVEWLCDPEVKRALLLAEEADPQLVARVTIEGYGNLNEDEVELVGRDPFLISYPAAAPAYRKIVTFEVSAPGQKRGKRKIPDACAPFGVQCCNLYAMIDALDFTTDWQEP